MKKEQSLALKTWVFILSFSIGIILMNAYYFAGYGLITGRASDFGTISLFILPPDTFINLTQGWNFVSFYTNMTNYSVTKVLEPIDGEYLYVQEWNSSSQEFNTYSVSGSKDFTEFDKNKSYFIFMLTDQQLPISGPYFSNLTIPLVNGWETPDYIYEYSTNITNNTFYNATFYYMQKWNVSNQDFLAYSPQAITKPFESIDATEGYFIRTDGGQLVYIRR